MKFFVLLLAFIVGQGVATFCYHQQHNKSDYDYEIDGYEYGNYDYDYSNNETSRHHVRKHKPLQKTRSNVQTRVVGGTNDKITSFPYTISLRFNGNHICGGSILDKNYIITAARCIHDNKNQASNFSIRAGSSFLNAGGTEVGVSEIKEHESFNPNTNDYDVAVLKLNSSLTFSDSIKSIPLATAKPSALTNGNLTGWGTLREGDKDFSNQLQVVKISISLTLTCRLHFGSQITERMFCAGTTGNDACKGDEGGPLAVNGNLVGIASFGKGCGRVLTPSVYESVPVLADWIRSKITA